jgi:hypothetical protein
MATWPVTGKVLGIEKTVDMFKFHTLYIVCAPWNTPLVACWRREEAEEMLTWINRHGERLAEKYPHAAGTAMFPNQGENHIIEMQGPALIGLFEEHGE